MIDTLSISAAEAAQLKDPSTRYNATTSASAYNKTYPGRFSHQVATAIFTGKYTLYNDSISLTVKSTPQQGAGVSMITDGTYKYGVGTNMSNEITPVWNAYEAAAALGYPNFNGISSGIPGFTDGSKNPGG